MFKVNLLTPGVEYEVGLTSKTSVNLELDTGFAIIVGVDRVTEFGNYPVLRDLTDIIIILLAGYVRMKEQISIG